ncbi:MAG: lytic transglycosylase domain-containing protein [Deltaproteobacteria bacterium]|nr:lytic transglycosylase domain-containing protein [Deltaproteobacteria bacterium]
MIHRWGRKKIASWFMRSACTLILMIRAYDLLASILPEDYILPENHSVSIGQDEHFGLFSSVFPDIKEDAEQWLLNGYGKHMEDSIALLQDQYGDKPSRLKGSALKTEVSRLIQIAEHNKTNEIRFLLPYLYEIRFRGNGSKESDIKSFFKQLSRQEAARSCPRFRLLRNRLTNRQAVNHQIQLTKIWLEDFSRSDRQESAEDVLKIFLSMIEPSKRKHYAAILADFPDRFDDILAPYHWISEEPDSSGINNKNGFHQVRSLIKRRKCDQAKQRLSSLMNINQKNHISSDEAYVLFQKMENCFRKKGYASRLQLFQFMIPRFEKAYGDAQADQLRYLQARLFWNRDKFDETDKILASLEKKSKERKDHKLLGKVLYLQAQVAENQELFEAALNKYQEYRTLFPDTPLAQEANRSQLIIRAGMKKWPEVLNLATQLIHSQQTLSADDRLVSRMGFALFWAGRAAMELGKNAEALEYWRMVARDYFSSYYGAVGHFMLEKMTGKSFALNPFFPKTFDKSTLLYSFPEHLRSQVQRAGLLLSAGLKDEAYCEASGLPENENIPAQMLTLAMLFHRSDRWLKSVQLFGALPRSFRKNLGYGVERVLFPRKYEQHVLKYSKKANIDAAFVFSVIRQESVFNPYANSVAGARGLMQLMKTTAKREARNIHSSYVSAAKKKQVLKKVRHRHGLYDSETNILLGTHYLKHLLNRYESVALALAAYNAGPTVVGRWRKKISWSDPFYFIEMIPYNETRGYVKLILRNYFYYKKWYFPDKNHLPQLDNLLSEIPSLARSHQNTSNLR